VSIKLTSKFLFWGILLYTLPATAMPLPIPCELTKPLSLAPFDIENEAIVLEHPVFDKIPNIESGRPLKLKLMKVTNRVKGVKHNWLGFRLYANAKYSLGMADVYDAEEFISMSGFNSTVGASTYYQSVYIRRTNPPYIGDSYYFTLDAIIENQALVSLKITVPVADQWPITKAVGYETLCLKKAILPLRISSAMGSL